MWLRPTVEFAISGYHHIRVAYAEVNCRGWGKAGSVSMELYLIHFVAGFCLNSSLTIPVATAMITLKSAPQYRSLNIVFQFNGGFAMEQIADTTGLYCTDGHSPGLWARMFPSITFYTQFVRLVLRFSALARKGLYGDAEWAESSLSVMRALENVGTQIEISGLQTMRHVTGACVIVANHMSTLETIILPGMIQPSKDVTFIVKRGIVEYPIFKHIMLARDPIVVDRTNPRADLITVLEDGARILRGGRSVIVFPQTTRTLIFDPAQFNTIGIKLAKRTEVPVIPVAVRSDAWGIGKFIKEFGKIDPSRRVHIAFGEPLTVQGRGHVEHDQVVDFIRTKLTEWGARVK